MRASPQVVRAAHRSLAAVCGLTVLVAVAAACTPTLHRGAPREARHLRTTRPVSPRTPHLFAIPSTTTTSTTTTVPEQPGWIPVAMGKAGVAVDERAFTYPDGSQVTVARFRTGQTRFDLHVGTEDPPTGSTALPPDAQPTVGSAEAPVLLAAFNGGFKTSTGDTGGFEVDGQTLRPLSGGMASFVIDGSGTGHVGVWGQDVPAPGEQVVSVRQNLVPLVNGSQPSAQASDVSAWGATLGGGAMVARSALGQDAQGDIVYAGSMSALPSDLADALVGSGVVTGMELDINPEWVQLDLAPNAGGPLRVGVPGQSRPPNQFASGWTRDFVTVLAAP